jgi:hypothetical protein
MNYDDTERLTLMGSPAEDKWDLSPNDRSAIRSALAELATLRARVAELEAERCVWKDRADGRLDRLNLTEPVVDAAVRWETSYGAGRHAVLTDAVKSYLAATPKEPR